MDFLHFTQRFFALGIAIMPLYHRSKVPMLSTWHELQKRLPTNTEYQNWFSTSWNNYAVICGWNNLVVLDFDTFEYFDLWRLVMRAEGLQRVVETSFKVVTSHGFHVYLKAIERAENEKLIAIS